MAIGIQLLHRLVQARTLGQALAEEPLFHTGPVKPRRGVDRVAPEDADDVIGVERRLEVFGIDLSRRDGILLRVPISDVLVSVL